MQRYVVTIYLAKRLKAAGWNTPTAFRWYTDELMDGIWCLGRIENEMVMLPAPMVDELFDHFSRKDIKIVSCVDGYLLSLPNGVAVKQYRLVDALGELWIERRKEKKEGI
jgi:hypothetical protein